MLERRQEELGLIQKKYGEIESDPDQRWLIIRKWDLPPGWSKAQTAVLILVPPGYPVTPPDNFYTDNDLRLANGGQPSNTTPNQSHNGGMWLQFSYHVEKEDWRPHADLLKGHNLLTFLAGVSGRFAEQI